MFAAEPPQERFRTVAGARRSASISSARPRPASGRSHGSPTTWDGRTYVPATAPAEDGGEVFGYVSYTREHEGAQATDFAAATDYTDETAAEGPDWTLDLSDHEIGHWRGPRPAQRGDAGLGNRARAEQEWRPDRLGPTTTDQCTLVEDHFTLVSLDAYTGDYVEVRLYGARGAELAP